jgi:Acetyltransferase (GNAT) domain
MSIEIHPVAEADLGLCARLGDLAFAANPLTTAVHKALFPEPPSQDADTKMVKELANLFHENPDVRMIKAVDPSLSGEEAIVGWAKWHIYPDGMPPTKPRQWAPPVNVEGCEYFFGGMDQMKNRSMASKPCMCELGPIRVWHQALTPPPLGLQPVITHPDHWRRGVGTQLIHWGLNEARSLGLPVFLIASPVGHALYQKCGFRDMEELVADLTPYGVGLHSTWAMIWESEEKPN